MTITISKYELSITTGRYDLFWALGDEFVLCKGTETLAYWRRIKGRWVNCKGY
jgi:hypothetical protein